jgi:hypothetical protein
MMMTIVRPPRASPGYVARRSKGAERFLEAEPRTAYIE